MELESPQTGSKIKLKNQTKLGRKSLSQTQTADKTISRHHITLNPNTQNQQISNFVVYGKNPIFVLHEKDGGIIKVYKSGEKGEMKVGDSFCVGFKDFVWFKLREISNDDDSDVMKMEELGVDFDDIGTAGGQTESLDDVSDVVDPVQGLIFSSVYFILRFGSAGGETESFDDHVSKESVVVDPVQEFKFLVIGHEFDHYPKKMIRDIRNWDWFLEEHKEDSDEDDEDEISNKKAKKGKRRKRKKGAANDDEDDDVWTGESEEDAELIKKLKNDPKPKYTTRSKDQKRSKKGASTSKSGKDTIKSSAMDVDVEDDDEDEDEADETLGGFIVDDEDVGEEFDEDVDEETDEDDEEEEFEEDEDDE